MSSVTPSNIAGSIAQGVAQQAQTAKAQDAARNRSARHAQQMRELLRKHMESVEDSFETADDHLRVEPQSRSGDDQQPSRDEQADEDGSGSAAAPPDSPVAGEDQPPAGRIDLTA